MKQCIIYITSQFITLHGITLREKIREKMIKEQSELYLERAKICNIRDPVEGLKIFCVFTEEVDRSIEDRVYDLLVEILTKNKEEIVRDIKVNACFLNPKEFENNLDFNFEGILIKRENELQEMTWALQGAGKVFMESLEVMREQQKGEIISDILFLESLKRELLEIHECLMNYDKILPERIRIKQFLISPPSNLYLYDEDKYYQLYEQIERIYMDINKVEYYLKLSRTFQDNDVLKLTDGITKLLDKKNDKNVIKLLDNSIKKIKDKLKKSGGVKKLKGDMDEKNE